MYIDKQGQCYVGDLAIGDREATEEEVAAWSAANTPSNALTRIAELEVRQVKELARFTREKTLADAEAEALAQFGISPMDLYNMGAVDGAPPPAIAYRKLKDLDNAIKTEREKLP